MATPVIDYGKAIAAYLDHVGRCRAYTMASVLQDIRDARHKCVFGAGMTSQAIVRMLKEKAGIDIDFLCDNDPKKWGTIGQGQARCISPLELEKYRGQVAIVIATKHYQEVKEQLQQRDFSPVYFIGDYRLKHDDFFSRPDCLDIVRNRVLRLEGVLGDEKSKEVLFGIVRSWFDFATAPETFSQIFTDDEYYPEGVVRLGDEEAFVDGGAYDGDSLLAFIAKTGSRFDAVYAFELDRGNFNLLRGTVEKIEPSVRRRIEIFNLGLYDREGSIAYEAGANEGQKSKIVDGPGTGNAARVVRLSDALRDRKVTFVKYDLEGADLKALHGAEDIIRRQRPKLAICVYHEPQHLWEVPIFLEELVPEYSLFLRHHSALEYGTVCYAVPRS